MLSRLINKLREIRHKRYIDGCVNRGMKIGKNTDIMPGCYFDDAYCKFIEIGDNCTLSNEVFILVHDASMYKPLKFTKVAKVIVGDNCFIGARVMILPGVTIGSNVIIGAGSVVVKDIPTGVVAAGNPAKVIRRIDEFLSGHKEKFSLDKAIWLDEISLKEFFCNAVYVKKKEDHIF